MKGQGRPIWILVTLLLALVVGVSMYRLIGKTESQKTFDEMFSGIDRDTALSMLNRMCGSWHDTNFAVSQSESDRESLAEYAARMGWLSAEEWEDNELFSECDCAMWLYTQGSITKTNAKASYDPDECHEKANEEAEDADIS